MASRLNQAARDIGRRRQVAVVFGKRKPVVRRGPVRRQKVPRAIELRYIRFILSKVQPFQDELMARLEPVVRREIAARDEAVKLDAIDDIDNELSVLRIKANGIDTSIKNQVRELGTTVADYQGSELQRQIKSAVGVEVPFKDAGLRTRIEGFTTENVGLIRNVKTQLLDKVQTSLLSGVTAGARWEEIAKQIQKQTGISDRRAALIARDQVGKFYGAVNQARQESLGLKSYTWRTSGDERVRDEHDEREGVVFQWDDPPEDGHPGEPVQCRCTAEPNFDELIEQVEEQEAPPEEEALVDLPDEPPPEEEPAPLVEGRYPINTPVDVPIGELSDIEALAYRPDRALPIARAIREGVELPPVRVATDVDGNRFLVDGNHRLAVSRAMNAPEVNTRFNDPEAATAKGKAEEPKAQSAPTELRAIARENIDRYLSEHPNLQDWERQLLFKLRNQ